MHIRQVTSSGHTLATAGNYREPPGDVCHENLETTLSQWEPRLPGAERGVGGRRRAFPGRMRCGRRPGGRRSWWQPRPGEQAEARLALSSRVPRCLSWPRPSPCVSEPASSCLGVAGAGTGRGIWKNHPDCIAVGEAAWRSRFPGAASPRGSRDVTSSVAQLDRRGSTWTRHETPQTRSAHRAGRPRVGKVAEKVITAATRSGSDRTLEFGFILHITSFKELKT